MLLPEFIQIRQRFSTDRLGDVAAGVRGELDGCGVAIPPGARVAVAVGSRGIANLALIVRETVAWLKARGAEPFVVPAMGSHGGATAQGQQEVLAGYGITEAAVGAPIRSSLAVVELERGDLETAVYFDALAHQADATLLINRIKPHTSFHGPYESGLMKMIAIGLGKHAQALAIHRFGVDGLRELMPRVARQILRHGNIVLGLAIVENTRDETLCVRAIRAADIPEVEPALLDLARRNMPRLPTDELDLLIVDEIGKNISGLGMDPNVIGRLKIRGQPEPAGPAIGIIIARDLAADSHGNAIGMGLADIVTRRLFDKVNLQATYENVLTSTFLERGKIPLIAATDREAVEFAIRALAVADSENLRIARIRNTLQLENLLVSPAALQSIDPAAVEVLGPSSPMFNREGNLRA